MICCLVGLLPGVVGCASTSMSSLPSPELAGRTFHTILVVAAFADLGIRRDTEDRFAASSMPGHYEFVPSYQLFFPDINCFFLAASTPPKRRRTFSRLIRLMRPSWYSPAKSAPAPVMYLRPTKAAARCGTLRQAARR